MAKTGYIVYLDEAGDFGLKRVAPLDKRGASEWFVIGAVVVRKDNEAILPQWLEEIRYAAKNNQSADLHFRTLSHGQKITVCGKIAGLDLRGFVMVSNKQNMRNYKNKSAEMKTKHRHWFYWWPTRLIMERVTAFCAHRNAQEGTPEKKLQIEFSKRNDLRDSHFTDYMTRLWSQGNKPHLNRRCIDWSVFDFRNVGFYEHRERAGLQFADVAASAFYQAVNRRSGKKSCAEYAKLLEPRVYKPRGTCIDEGFIVQPYSLVAARLGEDQKEVFRFYGCPEGRLTP